MRARILAVASAVSFVLFTPSAMAGAKVAIAASTVQVLKSAATAGGGSEWRTIIPSSIATSNGKTLVLGVSLECGLYTNTVTKSSNMVSDTSSAFARVNVRVLVNGKLAVPGEVVFCSRMQQLSSTLQGALLSCSNTLDMSTCTTSPETIALLLETMAANHFNFGLTLPQGTHRIEVQAKIDTSLNTQTGSAAANATIGKGSLTIEEVNLIPSGYTVNF